MSSRRPPWWMFVVLVPCAAYVLLTWYLYIFGPETPGLVYDATGVVRAVQPGLAADRAGVRAGDVILSVNGLKRQAWAIDLEGVAVGKRYELLIVREGTQRSVEWTTGRNTRAYWSAPEGLAALAIVPEGLLCTLLAWFIAFRRPGHATARLGAILFALAPASTIHLFHRPAGWPVAVVSLPYVIALLPVLAVVLVDSLGPLVVMFYANFPRPVVRGRWIWALLSVPALYQLTASVVQLVRTLGAWTPPGVLFRAPWYRAVVLPARLIGVGYLFAAAGTLLWNYRTLENASWRRRIRVFVAGFFVATVPTLFEAALRISTAYGSARASSLLLAYWFSPLLLFGSLLAVTGDLMQAYAILRHRLFDVTVIVRQGLQYAAARGVLLGLAPVFGLMLVGDLVWRSDKSIAQVFAERGWLYAALGAGALVAHARRNVWLSALDRRFFRERYDVQRVLHGVLTDLRGAITFGQAVPGAISQIDTALHPRCAAVVVRQPPEATFRAIASAGEPPPLIPTGSTLIALVRVLGKPLELQPSDSAWLRRQLPPDESQWLTDSQLEWVFPIALGAERTEALLVLGPKRSEEPYTREDQELIESIASGLALLHERLTPAVVGKSGTSSIGGLAVPPVAARYVIRRELGRGGMGTVYEATDTELERSVALKLMRPDLMAAEEAVARFRREARAAAGFSHPNVVTVYDVGVAEDGRAYLVMELLAGETVRQALRREKRLAAARALAIMRGVCAAVDAAHRRHLLHRDLKPENVFLVQAGGTEVPKILDFGVAKLLETGEETVLPGDTSPGQLLGTLAYMSPEQLRGQPPTPGWDLWALGVMAYEMLTGAYPFPTGVQRVADLEARRITPTAAHATEHSDRLDAFFACVLSQNVADRPATVPEWLARLELMMSDIGAGPPFQIVS